jgi:fucose permease
MALISTSVAFAVVGDIMGTLKTQFVLTNQQVGYIGGAALWGFTISIFALGPLVDVLTMRRLLWFAFLCHAVGPLIMIFAPGFWWLFIGALVIALGNGTVEAVCNPLVATIYPDRKTEKLNQFHVWFPGGIVIGGLLCFALTKLGIASWQVRLVLILIPTAIYGLLFVGQKFPLTERVQSGVSFSGMLQAAFFRPFFLLLFFCMMVTASLELGPNRWIPSILEAGGIHGILVLVWISGLMAVLRFFAGPVVHRLSPTGLLLTSAILAGIGLFWLSFAETGAVAFLAATVFALGVCYFWPTMLGVASERVPKGGALALALLGGIGMAVVGLYTSPKMGKIADHYLHTQLPVDQTKACLQKVVDTFPALRDQAKGKQGEDIQAAIDAAREALAATAAGEQGALPPKATANALRAAIGCGADSPVVGDAKAILNPADNYGGRMSFRRVAPFAIILVIVFGAVYASDRAKGGYKVEKIS